MLFDINDIGEEGVGVRLPVTAAWLAAECPDLDARAEGLALTGRLSRTGADFLLVGRLAGALVTPCVRCLEPARVTIDAAVTVSYVERTPGGGDAAGDDEALDAPDVMTFEDGVIDLGPELREELLLALPPKPLCREDCAGLCAVCGGNRNERPCDCMERERQATSKLASALGKLRS
jgi:uncharacterized protein